MLSALGILHGEHRSLVSVLQALRRFVRPLCDNKVKPDCEAFVEIVSYIETFADRFHHPKEDEFLFLALRNRTRHADGFLRDLQQEHAAGPAELDALKMALLRTGGGGVTEIQDFALRLDRYVRGQEEHLRKEEDIVIPIARQVLAAADWEDIDRAFHAHRDPFFGIGAAGPIGSLIPRAVGPT
jgi:branched-chain amino acid transport system ATP-binding protein